MKRIILAIIIIIISCSKTDKSSNKQPFDIAGTWYDVGMYDIDSLYDYKVNFDNKNLTSFTEFSSDSVWSEGYFDFNGDKKYDGDGFKVEIINDTVYLDKYLLVIKPKTNDSIWVEWWDYDSINPITQDKFALIKKRFPKYSPDQARSILLKKKQDLDLELISKKEYDSIKNSLKRYITD